MKHALHILVAIFAVCATAFPQTVKPLAYNITNGTVMVATNVTFTNSFKFSTNSVAAQVRSNLLLGANWLTNTNAATFRSDIGLGFAPLTNTNAETFRLDVGLGFAALTNTNATNFLRSVGLSPSNQVQFSNVVIESFPSGDSTGFVISASKQLARRGTNVTSGTPAFYVWDGFESTAIGAAQSRSNLGFTLPALTNTSNVTAMRALSGSTMTNEPFSGTVELTNTNAVLTFSNGILQSVQ